MKQRKARNIASLTTLVAALWVMLAVTPGYAQPAPGKKVPARAAATAASPAGEAQLKGIWEPVNYKEDIRFNDVFFVTSEEGWVAGQFATILHTTDGGQTWTVQLGGDPQSQEAEIGMLRFLDQRHGWAAQGQKLLATSDGENWSAVGNIAPGMLDYQFISPLEGLAIGDSNGYGKSIYQTKDGGRTWKVIVTCGIALEIDGLKQNVGCGFIQLRFSSSSIGYALGGNVASRDHGPPVIAKTEDGGQSWKIILGPGEPLTSTLDGGYFLDDRTGYVRVRKDAKLFATSDAGGTWREMVAAPGADLRFADPEVGWSIDYYWKKLVYTTDGGKRWSSRAFAFPAAISAFSLPRRDRGYIVGEHGMVYRYRVVPVNYTAKGMVDAPLMPTFGGPLLGHLQDMKAQVAALKAKLGAAAGKPAASESHLPRPIYGGGAEPADTTEYSNDAQQSGQSTPAAGGFVQDTSSVAPSPFVQDCCAPQVQSMQSSFGSFSQQVPSFNSQYRSLNLIFAGLSLVSELLGKKTQIGNAFGAFKQATDAISATTALNDLSSKLDSTHQAVSMGYSNFNFTGAAAGIAGAVQNAVTGAANPNSPAATTPPATQADAEKAKQDAKKAAADELKKKLKKFPF